MLRSGVRCDGAYFRLLAFLLREVNVPGLDRDLLASGVSALFSYAGRTTPALASLTAGASLVLGVDAPFLLDVALSCALAGPDALLESLSSSLCPGGLEVASRLLADGFDGPGASLVFFSSSLAA